MLSRKDVVRACRGKGWTIQPAALEGVLSLVNDKPTGKQDEYDALEAILELISNELKGQPCVTAKVWDAIVAEYESNAETAMPTSQEVVEVVNAFSMPRLTYDSMRKQFQVEESKKGLFGTAEDKIDMLAQRYALIHQRILRHELFRPSDLHSGRGGARSVHHKLTPIESLLGKRQLEQTILLLAVLVQIEQGAYYLEDPTGQVRVSFDQATLVDDFFVTEHSIFLVEGTFYEDIFYVHRLGQPLQESRESALQSIQQQVFHLHYVLPKSSFFSGDDNAMIILSDVHLDKPRVMQQLEGLLASYDHYTNDRMPLFVLMGNFCSTPQLHPSYQSKGLLDDLAHLIARFANLSKHAHFCLVPGPHDGGGAVLPRPALPATNALKSKIAHVHLCTNPCRLRWADCEVVCFRHDVRAHLQHHHLRLPTAPVPADKALQSPHARLIKTVLDQAHLMPVAGTPIFWNYDAAMRLYPMPNVLILGDNNAGSNSSNHDELYLDCRVVNVGSLAAHGTYAMYQPGQENDDEEGDEGNDAMPAMAAKHVVFGCLGTETDSKA